MMSAGEDHDVKGASVQDQEMTEGVWANTATSRPANGPAGTRNSLSCVGIPVGNAAVAVEIRRWSMGCDVGAALSGRPDCHRERDGGAPITGAPLRTKSVHCGPTARGWRGP